MKITIVLFFISMNVFALETDNYIAWDKDLKDSRTEINQFFAAEISNVIQKADGKNKSCSEIKSALARSFKSIGVKDNPVENYIVSHLKPEQYYPHTFDYVKDSIYRNPYMPHIPGFGLSPNINVNGFYIGTDKLSHFASTGYIYYLIYSTFKKKGEEEALKSAINYGVKDEKALHGYWASGVFSFADLEANFQGLMFYRRICGEEKSYLSQDEEGNWKMKEVPDFADFVSGNWDESYRTSYFVSGNWKKVKPVLKTYCEASQSERILSRRNYYKSSSRKSFSHEILDDLKMKGEIPNPDEQSLQKLCVFQ